jgi:hypothetical protein
MAVVRAQWRIWLLSLAVLLLISNQDCLGQAPSAATPNPPTQISPPGPPPAPSQKPLPDLSTLMKQVEANQRTSEAVLKDYLYHEVATEEHLDGHGAVKKTESREYDIFWLNGVEVAKLVKKDGKELSPDEKKKEDEEIDKEVAKAKERRTKADSKGEDSDSHGEEKVTFSRLLALGSFTNPRRVILNGRDSIAVDYTGNPKAKTQNRMEDVMRDVAGTVWIDEEDHTIARIEGHFLNAFKVGGGLVVNVKQGTNFSFEQRKINGEVWLPVRGKGEGSVRALLFVSFNGRIQMVTSDYRKFKATATVLPGMSTIEQQPETRNPQQ